MKKYLSLIPLVLFLCFMVGCQEQEAEETGLALPTDEDVATIMASTEAFAQAWKSGDFDALLALYTEDAVLMPPNSPRIQGREGFMTFMREFPPLTDATLTAQEISGRGDLAYVVGSYSITFMMEGVPEPITDVGKYIEIRLKQPDGAWLIARDIFNSDMPLQ